MILKKKIEQREEWEDGDNKKYLDFLFKNLNNEIFSEKDASYHEIEFIRSCIKVLDNHFNFSFRNLEKIFNYISMFYKTLPSKNHFRMAPILIGLIVIKIKDSQLYKKLVDWNSNFQEIKSFFKWIDEDKYSKMILNRFEFSHLSEAEMKEKWNAEKFQEIIEHIWRFGFWNNNKAIIKSLTTNIEYFR